MRKSAHLFARILHRAVYTAIFLTCAAPAGLPAQTQVVPVTGARGGELVVPVSEFSSFNPAFATDATSRMAIRLTMADLMHINERTLEVEPGLAVGVEHRTATQWIAHLRQGVQWSDGTPFTAADVVFTVAVHTDAKLNPPGRDLWLVGGRPITCKAINASTVEFDLPGAIAVGDRLFDGIWILPRHLLEPLYTAGKLEDSWSPATPPAQMAGLGPFVIGGYQPGNELVLRRNPHYWRTDSAGQGLPYLDALHLRIVPDQNLRVSLFARGQVDGLESLRVADAASLANQACCRTLDGGAGLDPTVLELNQAPGGGAAREWFRQTAFRQALSLGVDRANLVRNVFQGHATALASLTSPAMKHWADPASAPTLNAAAARQLLASAGFQTRADGLYDARGRRVEFSLIVQAANPDRMKMATFLQEDLRGLGMTVRIVALEGAAFADRLQNTRDFDAVILGWGVPDADPNVEGAIWSLEGQMHFWNPAPKTPTAWEIELDRLYKQQVASPDAAARLRLYRRIQGIEHDQLPVIPLVSGNILIGAKPALRGVAPALLAPHLLWNAEQLSWPAAGGRGARQP